MTYNVEVAKLAVANLRLGKKNNTGKYLLAGEVIALIDMIDDLEVQKKDLANFAKQLQQEKEILVRGIRV